MSAFADWRARHADVPCAVRMVASMRGIRRGWHMFQGRSGFGFRARGTRRIDGKRFVTMATALLPILLAAAFASHRASASTVVDLGTADLSGKVDAMSCFLPDPCDDRPVNSPNASTGTPYSAASTTAILSTAPSISSSAEADMLTGGGQAPAKFGSSALSKVALDYHFDVQGPEDILVPVAIQAHAKMDVTGDFASVGYSWSSEADLVIDGQDLNIVRQGEIDDLKAGAKTSGSYDIDQTLMLHSNTAYEVSMLVQTGASIFQGPGTDILANLFATASIDPTVQVGPGFSAYSVVFSSGIGAAPTATPLPPTLPLFGGGLGFVGYLARQKRKAALASA
jgi:hypothetical protein